jgi:hypothetical protein
MQQYPWAVNPFWQNKDDHGGSKNKTLNRVPAAERMWGTPQFGSFSRHDLFGDWFPRRLRKGAEL